MARKPKIPEHVNHERWLVSYADFITLLFAFFTVLYATAQTDAGKVNKLIGAVDRAFSAGIFSGGSNELMFNENGNISGHEIIDLGMNLKDVEKNISQAMEREGLTSGDGVKLERHADGLTLILQSRSFFAPGSDILRPDAAQKLGSVIGILKRSPHRLRVEGHTDNMPIHNAFFVSNWELSAARALSVLHYLERSGVPGARMSAAGMGEFHPLQPNLTQEGRSRNRRVEIVILENKPSFWAPLKKPTGSGPSGWQSLISNDQVTPPAAEEKSHETH